MRLKNKNLKMGVTWGFCGGNQKNSQLFFFSFGKLFSKKKKLKTLF